MAHIYPAFLSNNGDKIPAGLRVVEPIAGTKAAERGNLYAIVDLHGAHPEREQLVEQMLGEIENGYFSHKGKQSAVMLHALEQAMTLLADFNHKHPKTPLSGGAIAVGILNERMMVANAGALFAMLSVGQNIEMFPTEATGDGQVNPSVLRREVTAGDALFVGATRWEEAIPLRILAATVAHIDPENRFDAASGILEQIESAPPPGLFLIVGDDLSTLHNSKSSAPLSRTRRSTLGNLPTSVGAPPPATARPLSSTGVSHGPAPTYEPPNESANESANEQHTFDPLLGEAEEEVFDEPKVEPQIASKTLRQTPSETPLDRLGRFFKGLLPESPRETEKTASHTIAAASAQEAQRFEQGDSATDQPANRDQTVTSKQRQAYTPPVPARGGRARMFIFTALAIALITGAVVAVTVWQQGIGIKEEAATQLEIALSNVGSAQTSVDTGDKEGALKTLQVARTALEAREKILGGTDPQSTEVAQQIAEIEQQVLQVKRLYGLVQPLVQFPAGSRPTRVLVVDQDIYILDEGRQVVERYRLDQNKESVPEPTPQVLLRQGDTVDGAQVGALVDFTWQLPVPGYDDKANLFILDGNNNVFRFNPRVDGAGLINLGGEDKVIKAARQLKSFTGRLYVADVGTNQLYRFQPGEYEIAPETWFPEGTQINLSGLHTMRIDGNIWMLMDDGEIFRFFNGQQAPFALDNRLGLAQQPVDLAVSEEDNGRLFLADRAQSRVIVYDKNGGYVSQLAAPEGNPLENLSGLFVEDVTNTLYLLTDSALFQHDLLE